MSSYDAGHVETRTRLPEPLASIGFWNIGNFALPSMMLSVASAAVFAVVAAFLFSGGRQQQLFVLPTPYTFVIGAMAALMAWLIALVCSKRPGRIGPRLWAFTLAIGNTAFAVIAAIVPHRSFALALSVAGFAAALTLAPRLIKLRPDSVLVQYIAPLSVLMILLIILPSSCAARRTIIGETAVRVDRRIQEYRLWTSDVKEIVGFGWRNMEGNADSAAKTVARLKELHFEPRRDDPEIWRSAAILGKDGELGKAVEGLTESVASGFDPGRIPRVSDLKEPALRWDAQAKRWETYSQFGPLSEVAGTYHMELGRLFAELHDVPADSAVAVEYREHYASQRGEVQAYLNETVNTWADNWAVFRVPGHTELIGRENTPLAAVLRTAIVKNDNVSYAAADLQQITALPLHRIQEMARGASGCGRNDTRAKADLAAEPTARGCHCQNFDEGNREYFRLDCYAYSPAGHGTGANLRVEMRIVYESAGRQGLAYGALPSEIYFHFIVPEGKDGDAFREEVMTSLAAAARESAEEGTQIRTTDRGGSVATGFDIGRGYGAVHVLRPTIVWLAGPKPEPEAVMVRVVRGSGGYGRLE